MNSFFYDLIYYIEDSLDTAARVFGVLLYVISIVIMMLICPIWITPFLLWRKYYHSDNTTKKVFYLVLFLLVTLVELFLLVLLHNYLNSYSTYMVM